MERGFVAATQGCSSNIRAMGALVIAVVTYIRVLFVTRHRLALEAAALRQQLAVFKRKQPRPRLSRVDRLFWTTLRRVYSGRTDALIIVKPETVVSWHRAGFRLLWRWRSRPPRRPKVTGEIRELIRRMKAENPDWGAPRIHGELLQLGFKVSEPTVSRLCVIKTQFRAATECFTWSSKLSGAR